MTTFCFGVYIVIQSMTAIIQYLLRKTSEQLSLYVQYSLCSLEARYDNPIPTRFRTPIPCSKIPAPIVSVTCLQQLVISRGKLFYLFILGVLTYWCDSQIGSAIMYGGPLPYPHGCSSAKSPYRMSCRESNHACRAYLTAGRRANHLAKPQPHSTYVRHTPLVHTTPCTL